MTIPIDTSQYDDRAERADYLRYNYRELFIEEDLLATRTLLAEGKARQFDSEQSRAAWLSRRGDDLPLEAAERIFAAHSTSMSIAVRPARGALRR